MGLIHSTASEVYRRILPYLPVIIIFASQAGCGRKPGKRLSEGRITYQITYTNDKIGGYKTTVLPQEMTLEFTPDMVRNSIVGGLGFFNLVNIQDLDKLQNTTYLKFIDKRYIYQGERREPPCCTGILAYMQLEFTDKTKQIMEFECKQAIATFPDQQVEPFEIWYTDAFDISRPNGNSPFAEIPGILLEFNTIMGNSNMHLVATDYEAVSIPQKLLKPPKNYRPVTRDEMETILVALMD